MVDLPVPLPPTNALNQGENSSRSGDPCPMNRALAISTHSMKWSGVANGEQAGSGSSLGRMETSFPSSNASRSPSREGEPIFTHVKCEPGNLSLIHISEPT